MRLQQQAHYAPEVEGRLCCGGGVLDVVAKSTLRWYIGEAQGHKASRSSMIRSLSFREMKKDE